MPSAMLAVSGAIRAPVARRPFAASSESSVSTIATVRPGIGASRHVPALSDRARAPIRLSRSDGRGTMQCRARPWSSAAVVLAADACDDDDAGVPPRAIDANDMNYVNAAIAVGVGLAVRFLLPVPDVLTPQAWSLFAIFCSTVTGLVIKPAPVGAWAFMALTVTVASRTLTFQQGLAALTNEVIWLIVVATFFARAFIKTGFGDRLGLLFVRAFGSTTLKLAYGLQTAEAVLSPAMPSTTARAAGVFAPIISSLDPRTRGYLVGQQLQGGNATSTLLISAAAQNFLCVQLAAAHGVTLANPFVEWFTASSVPCILSILVTPIVMYALDPPELKDTPEAPVAAQKALDEMGPPSSAESRMCAGLGVTVVLWIFGAQIGVSSALAAMIGLSILITLGVLTWNDALDQKGAWDTLLWFSILISMSGQLNDMGVVGYFSGLVSAALTAANMSWMQAFGLLHFGYFIMHYFFASQSAHVGALYPAFLSMMLASGAPPMLAAISLAFNTNLFGGLTHYASGQSAVYFSSGAISLPKLWKQGAYMAVINAIIFGVVGMAWWKVIGLW